jgi:UPF0716 protein FxsA
MLRYLPIFLLVGFFLEIASIIWVGGAIGVIPTLLLLIAGGIVGISLFRSAGVNAASVLRSPVQDRSLVQGLAGTTLLRISAGMLFMVPGFFSDAIAVLLFLPPVQQWFRSRVKGSTFSMGDQAAGPMRRQDTVIDVEAMEIHGEVEPPRQPDNRS